MIVAVSQFRLANGIDEAVKQALRDRPRLLDQAPGFVGLEALVSAEDGSVFLLVTRWTDVESFRAWESSEAHVQWHGFISKGLRFDPAYTKLTFLHEIKGAKDDPRSGVDRTWTKLVSDYVWDSGVVRLLIADLDGALKACSSGAAELLRAPAQELTGKLLWTYLTEPDAAKLREWVRSSERKQAESMLLNFVSGDNCVPCTLECTVSVQSGVFAVIGHTAYQQQDALENQLLEINNELTVAMRDRSKWNRELTALGVLAGGIAHDFNNMLGGILANAEIAESLEADGSFPGEEIQNIKAISMRASGIVRQLMIYAGKEKSKVEPVDLSELVDEMMNLMKVSMSKSAVVRTVLGKNLPTVLGIRPEIQQVVMNLVLNASDALGGREGVITVTTALGRPNVRATSRSRIDLEDYVRLDVSDTGPGISDEAKTKIFDPFFTTKTAGRGLGLAVVQGVIRAHKGVIEVISEPGQGTTFQIFWPITGKAPDQSSWIASPGGSAQNIGIHGTILVVEDEDYLRIAIAKILRKEGLAVIEVDNGTAAVEVLSHHQGEIDVILLDTTIPGEPSNIVIKEAGKLRPNARLLLTSAYGPEVARTLAGAGKVKGFIRKPFHLRDLVTLTRETLSSQA